MGILHTTESRYTVRGFVGNNAISSAGKTD